MDSRSRLPVWLRNPRYTGVNRCVPCTLVNLGIAMLLAVGVAVVSIGWALAVLATAVTIIAVRGYLIPGTPALTKRYLPDRVLALFDKRPDPESLGDGPSDGTAVAVPGSDAVWPDGDRFDAAEALVNAGVLVDDPIVDDLVLDASFRDAWEHRSRELADGDGETNRDGTADRRALARFLAIDPESVSLVDRGYAYVATIERESAGQWESRQAFVADLAAASVLVERWDGWASLPTAHRSELLGALRLFVETCPTCDGTVTLDSTVVESCCRQYDVLAATCGDCGARLFEADVDPRALERVANAS